MTDKFLLDTNAYALFFIRPKQQLYQRLIRRVQNAEKICFYISEITSLEIHSVLGKYRRGNSIQKQLCGRNIILPNESIETCQNIWYRPARKKLKRKVYRGILKLLSDFESGKSDIEAIKLDLSKDAFKAGAKLLTKYCDKYNLGSHDALIAGTLVDHNDRSDEKATLITSDKGLKNVLKEESIPFYDPNHET